MDHENPNKYGLSYKLITSIYYSPNYITTTLLINTCYSLRGWDSFSIAKEEWTIYIYIYQMSLGSAFSVYLVNYVRARELSTIFIKKLENDPRALHNM